MEDVPVPHKKFKSFLHCFTKLYSSDHQHEIFEKLNLDRKLNKTFCDVSVTNQSHELCSHKCLLWLSGCFRSILSLEFIIENFSKFNESLCKSLLALVEAIYQPRCKVDAFQKTTFVSDLSELELQLNLECINKWCVAESNPAVEAHACALKRMLALLNQDRHPNSITCDAVICCGEEKIFVHKCILGCASDFFRTLLTTTLNDMIEQKSYIITGIKAPTAKLVIDFIYLCEVVLTEDNSYDILACSDYFLMNNLKDMCCNFFCTCLNNTNFLKIYNCAETYSLKGVLQNVAEYFYFNLWQISDEILFTSLTVDKLFKFLTIKCECRCEDIVYIALIRWLKHDFDKRQCYIAELAQHLYWKKCSIQFLQSVTADELYSCSVSKLLSESLQQQVNADEVFTIYFVHYSCSNYFYSEESVVMKYNLFKNKLECGGSCNLPSTNDDSIDAEEYEAEPTGVFLDASYYIIGICGKKVFKLCFADTAL